MRFVRPCAALAVFGAVALPMSDTMPQAQAQAVSDGRQFLSTLTRISTQYGLAALRTVVDLTYEHIAVDPRTGDIVITGLNLYPTLAWDQEGSCAITIDRVSRTDEVGFEVIESSLAFSGMSVALSCFDPEQAAMLAAFDYDVVTVDDLAMTLAYEFASSAATMAIHASVRDAVAVTLTADFDYIWVSLGELGPDGLADEPVPVAQLGAAEIAVENRGLYERLEPMLASQLGDLQAAPQMVEAGLLDALSEGGTRTPGAEEMRFVQNLAEEVGRFIAEKNRIVLSAAPEGGVWLDEAVFATPASTIAALQPKVSLAPLASLALVPAAELAAVIAGQAPASETAAVTIGTALLTGVGAPRSVEHGKALLIPLAENWDWYAAMLLAEALADEGEATDAYRMALRAAAGAAPGALALADTLEQSLDAGEILGLQAEVGSAWPDRAARDTADEALLGGADIAGMRTRAQNTALGRDIPRNYADAYYWASLAAAAGDRSAAGLRERLDKRFAGTEGAARDAWKAASRDAAERAIGTWTEGGLGARVAAHFGVAQ